MEPEEKNESQNQEEKTEDTDLDGVFGQVAGEEPKETSGDPASDSEEQNEPAPEKTEEELAAEKVTEETAATEAKEAYEKLTPEEKTVEDKKVADAEEVTRKAEFEKLSPEEKKTVTDKFEAEEKEAAVKEKAETKIRFDEQNQALSKSEKRRTDTERWAQERHQESLQLRRENIILQKQAKDPEYDPEQDESLKEVGPTEEEKDMAAQQRGRTSASMRAAFDKYGEEIVRAELAEYKVVFGEDEAVRQQVLNAEQPVEEALSVLRLNKFFIEFGSDPKAIISKVETKLRTELTPKIRDEESKRIMADLKKTSKLPKGISGVKTAGSITDEKKETVVKPDSLEKIFD